jgi:hypothetical protein
MEGTDMNKSEKRSIRNKNQVSYEEIDHEADFLPRKRKKETSGDSQDNEMKVAMGRSRKVRLKLMRPVKMHPTQLWESWQIE